MPVVPLGDRKLRACLATGLIKTEEQWYKDGCALVLVPATAIRAAAIRAAARRRAPFSVVRGLTARRAQPRHLRVHRDAERPRGGARLHVAEL